MVRVENHDIGTFAVDVANDDELVALAGTVETRLEQAREFGFGRPHALSAQQNPYHRVTPRSRSPALQRNAESFRISPEEILHRGREPPRRAPHACARGMSWNLPATATCSFVRR